jgi:hypothetical protein
MAPPLDRERMYVKSSTKKVFPKKIPNAILTTAAIAALIDICFRNRAKEIQAAILPVIRAAGNSQSERSEKNGIHTAMQN